MIEIKVEKGIPVPTTGDRRSKYPWHKLEVGDSFFVPEAEKRGSVSAYYTRLLPKKFTMRTEGKGLRVWRIA